MVIGFIKLVDGIKDKKETLAAPGLAAKSKLPDRTLQAPLLWRVGDWLKPESAAGLALFEFVIVAADFLRLASWTFGCIDHLTTIVLL